MKDLKTIQKLKQMDAEIKNGTTGTPKELGKKIGRNVSTVHNYIRILKLWGGQIKYSRQAQTYVYTTNKELFIGYV